MLRALIISIFTFAFISSPAFAQKTIKLSPKESKSLTNSAMWTLNATCNIQGVKTKGKILVSVVENKGKVNGKNLSKGQATSLRVKSNDNIAVSAEPGTTVNLVNLGADTVEAVCYT